MRLNSQVEFKEKNHMQKLRAIKHTGLSFQRHLSLYDVNHIGVTLGINRQQYPSLYTANTKRLSCWMLETSTVWKHPMS